MYLGEELEKGDNMIEEKTNRIDYKAFMLRLWRVKTKEKNEWRASLENPNTGNRYLFSDLESLFSYLSDVASDREENSENGEETNKKIKQNQKSFLEQS